MTTLTTATVAGYGFALEPGRRYLASRAVAMPGQERFTVNVSDITDGYPSARPVESVAGLTYDEANALLAAFNNGRTSFEGRVWT